MTDVDLVSVLLLVFLWGACFGFWIGNDFANKRWRDNALYHWRIESNGKLYKVEEIGRAR
jgi:hypothetical protein